MDCNDGINLGQFLKDCVQIEAWNVQVSDGQVHMYVCVCVGKKTWIVIFFMSTMIPRNLISWLTSHLDTTRCTHCYSAISRMPWRIKMVYFPCHWIYCRYFYLFPGSGEGTGNGLCGQEYISSSLGAEEQLDGDGGEVETLVGIQSAREIKD